MKTLVNHTLIYDDQCPLCEAYTRGFIKCGILDSQGRESYSDAAVKNTVPVNWDRARNEIALIDKQTNTVRYGVESLTYIVGTTFPVLNWIFRFKPVRFLLQTLYFFISYNRKVIAPGKKFEAKNACTPDLHPGYRWAFIFVTWLITSVVLVYYSTLIFPMVPKTNFLREFLICGGQIIFQGSVVLLIRKNRVLHYLGNMMTVSFAGAMLLCPAFLLTGVIANPWIYLGYFALVVSLMFLEHMRRVSILELPGYVSASWVCYRCIVLLFILS